MNKKRIVQLCCAALVVSGIGLNIQNAIAGYGIGENSLSLVAGPGSNSGSNSNSNSNSNFNSNSNSDSNWDSNWDTSPKPEKYIYNCVEHTDEGKPDVETITVLPGETPPANGVYNSADKEHGVIIRYYYDIPVLWIHVDEICEKVSSGKYKDSDCKHECKGSYDRKEYV